MDTKELLKKVRKIEIKTRRLSDHVFGGEYHSTFKGRGMTFSEVRQYQFGDDVRSIDWNVTARYNEPFVKVFEEERELTMMLLVDVSASEMFGTQEQFKKDVITEIAATLAFSATQNNDKIGLMLFTDQIELYIPPKKGRLHVLRIIRELLEFKPAGKKTDIANALKYLSNVMKKKAIVFVLSDFLADDYRHTLKIAANRHDVTGIRVYDEGEESIPNLGLVQMYDEETGRYVTVNTGSKSVRNAYAEYYRERLDYFQQSFSQSGAGVISNRTDESYVKNCSDILKGEPKSMKILNKNRRPLTTISAYLGFLFYSHSFLWELGNCTKRSSQYRFLEYQDRGTDHLPDQCAKRSRCDGRFSGRRNFFATGTGRIARARYY